MGFGGGLKDHDEASVATDGTVTDGPKEYLGGFTVVDAPSCEERWSGLPRSPSPAAVIRRSGFASRKRL